MNYLLHLFVLIALYVLLAQSLNLAAGYAGVVSLAHAVFFGIGAYAAALLTLAGWSFLVALIVGVLIASVASLAVSLPALRLTGDYLVLCTLAAQVVGSGLFLNWVSLTRGPGGVNGIPHPKIFAWTVVSRVDYLVLTGTITFVVLGALFILMRAPFGRSLRAVRDDESAAAALGKNTGGLRMAAFAAAAACAAVAGALFAAYSRFIDPTSFTLGESIFILATLVVGGSGRFRGPIVGAVTLILLPEFLSAFGVSDTTAAQLQQVVYGLTIVLLMRWRPAGLLGEYQFR